MNHDQLIRHAAEQPCEIGRWVDGSEDCAAALKAGNVEHVEEKWCWPCRFKKVADGWGPRRAVELVLRIHADDDRELIRAFEELLEMFQKAGRVEEGIWAGVSGSNSRIVNRRKISPDEFQAELKAWFEEQKR